MKSFQIRIEAGTFLIIAAAAGERVIIQNIIPQHLEALISKLKEMGVKMDVVGDSIVVYGAKEGLKPVDNQELKFIQGLRLICNSHLQRY